MARFSVTGMDETLRQMQRLGQESGDAAKSMLQAGAEKIKTGWRAAIMAHELIRSGDMLGSVGFKRTPKKIGDALAIDIYPQGVDYKGTRNAEKAFILHYGTSTRKPTRFVDDAEKMGEAMAIPAMEEVWDQYIQTGNPPKVPLTPNHPGGVGGK